jgi:hypothetical protein
LLLTFPEADLTVLEGVAGCLLQLTLFDQLDAGKAVCDVMATLMLALNTRLHSNTDQPKVSVIQFNLIQSFINVLYVSD